jgi:hypothetical protein
MREGARLQLGGRKDHFVGYGPSLSAPRRDNPEAVTCGHDSLKSSLTEKHHQRGEQRLRIVLTLIYRRRRRAVLEQEVNRLPRGAGGVFDGERDILRNPPRTGR